MTLPSWRDAAAAHGFGVLCIRCETGEWFTVSSVKETKTAIFGNAGLYPFALVSEPVLIEKLAHAGVSESEALSWVHLAKQWATTFRRRSHTAKSN